MQWKVFFFFFSITIVGYCQGTIEGRVHNTNGLPIEFANVWLNELKVGASTNIKGEFRITNVPLQKEYTLQVSALGYTTSSKQILSKDSVVYVEITMEESKGFLNEMVVSGTMKEVSKTDSPIPVEVYSSAFFQSNPSPSIFESIQQVNGVRPQLNCNVCNTGDIHINGLEGPYTSVLIDGMPIVSGLSSVYGLTGIPQSLIQRVEIVKGPSSTLYGSEAVGGIINIITKNPSQAPVFSVDVMSSSWGEVNTDVGLGYQTKKVNTLVGINYFNYAFPKDKNGDGFTDVTLQNRISIFNKWKVNRQDGKTTSLAVRYNYEDRWGGDMRWNTSFRGGDSIYGESIYTNRWEAIGLYQLPVKEKINISFSANGHYQNSVYGNVLFLATQYVGFVQLTWDKTIRKHSLLSGLTYKQVAYDDNTTATSTISDFTLKNKPTNTSLPGVFMQDEITFNEKNKLLAGLRLDYNSIHQSIVSPRINYKWNTKDKYTTLRVGIGNGYRVVNVFTEDHASLTGAREIQIVNNLKPETSWNVTINGVQKWSNKKNVFLTFDGTIFYTYFDNRIVADYTTDVNKIIYDNLNGFGVSKGVSLSMDGVFTNGLKGNIGVTIQDVTTNENGIKINQLLTEKFSGVWSIGYSSEKYHLSIDYTGKVYGPMELPLLGPLDERSRFSPWFSIQNIQLTKKIKKQIEIYAGVKNLLNFVPPANSIARSFDPFDKQVQFDANGNAIATSNNPQALTFDPTYVYASNQGIRLFVGFRYTIH